MIFKKNNKNEIIRNKPNSFSLGKKSKISLKKNNKNEILRNKPNPFSLEKKSKISLKKNNKNQILRNNPNPFSLGKKRKISLKKNNKNQTRRNKPNLFSLGKKWKLFLKKIKFEKKKVLTPEIQSWIYLKKKLKSKLSPFFFKPWMKKKRVRWTKKQRYLRNLSAKYRSRCSFKKRKDFFKTSFGEILKISQLNSDTGIGFWLSGHAILRARKLQRIKKKTFFRKKMPWIYVKHPEKQYQLLRNSMQKGWLYENLLKKRSSRNAKHFLLDRPQTAFQNHFRQQKKEPWVDVLQFKRWTYFGFIEKNKKEIRKRSLKLKDYLQTWNPRFQKRNKLYYWRRKLLFDFHHRNTIKKDKAQRIKQIIGKIYLPFYGHLKQKQFQKILKKKKKVKSLFLNKNETVLSALENRLDVVVYRLNLAPNILWARRLIQEGSIFVNNIFSFSTWTSMYSQFKKLSFPLKLRDPKNLYKKKFWNPNHRLSQFKFLLKPTKKIYYLVQPGDLIQSAKSLSLNSMKINKRLWKKPIPKHLYTIPKLDFQWNNATKASEIVSAARWREPKEQRKTALFLFNPKFTDLQKTGRIQELFFRWMTL